MGQGKLTVKKIRALKESGLYGDGNTLFMRVARGGSEQWVQRLVIHGKRRDIGRGGLSWVTLDEAREMAWKNQHLARLTVSQELGHERTQIVTAYYGA